MLIQTFLPGYRTSLFYSKHFLNLCCIIESDGRFYEVAYNPTLTKVQALKVQVNMYSVIFLISFIHGLREFLRVKQSLRWNSQRIKRYTV